MGTSDGQRSGAPAVAAGKRLDRDLKIDAPSLEELLRTVNQRERRDNCSIYKVPQSMRGADHKSAYTPEAVTIGPCHHNKDATPDSYKDMQDFKCHAINYFKSLHTDVDEPARTQILLGCMEELEKDADTIKSYYAYEITLTAHELAQLMMLDGCFILYFILKGKQSYYDLGGIQIRHRPVKRDLLLLENQIPFFVIKKLHAMLRTESAGPIDLVDKALSFLRDIDLPMNRRIQITPDVPVSHLLDLVHLSLVFETCSLDSTDPVWRIPSATELREYGMAFDKRDGTRSFLDVNVRRRRFTRRAVMEIPPLALYDTSMSLFCNLIAFEQCHPDAGLDVTVYAAFMACIIHTDEDVRLLHLNGILINCMTGKHDLTQFFRCLCTGAHTAVDRFYLVHVFAAVAEYRERNLWWVDFKRCCRDKWSVIAIGLSILITFLTIINTLFGVVLRRF